MRGRWEAAVGDEQSSCQTQSLAAQIAAGGVIAESGPSKFGTRSLGTDLMYWSNAMSKKLDCDTFLIPDH